MRTTEQNTGCGQNVVNVNTRSLSQREQGTWTKRLSNAVNRENTKLILCNNTNNKNADTNQEVN